MGFIQGDGYRFKAEYDVLEKIELGELVLVIYNYMDMPGPERKNNFIAYDKLGNRVWVAEGPGESVSAYYKIASSEPLRAHSFCSHTCTISPLTGELIAKVFYK